ncbi:sigma-70 family RNA polymerase sigma factor [Imperialibacter roseus]|uniref:Sigma-70 family RNA polymerase sigma factor n=1 Tax=Imperialibacter roseus TaxID=1324217 RepID=A0ABZ0IY24_9BACT|nr:sigma-70 family RNA polymerase sigma factor [Imperialibacter roseus]WOK09417.1 sigma-70 family RNA polymerase sigma factor [Imperialibacter roseus]
MNQTQTITLYQPLLHRLALKMVGSWQDAEDIVQDTFLKWLTLDQEKIKNTKAYLIKSVTNSCINHLNSIKRKKNEYLDAINPKEFVEKLDLSHIDIEHEISTALAMLHKKLEPVERAVYLLREVFNIEYDELQQIVNKKKENCRQLFSRAKEKLAIDTSKISFDMVNSAQLIESFKKACSFGEPKELIEDLRLEISQKA